MTILHQQLFLPWYSGLYPATHRDSVQTRVRRRVQDRGTGDTMSLSRPKSLYRLQKQKITSREPLLFFRCRINRLCWHLFRYFLIKKQYDVYPAIVVKRLKPVDLFRNLYLLSGRLGIYDWPMPLWCSGVFRGILTEVVKLSFLWSRLL